MIERLRLVATLLKVASEQMDVIRDQRAVIETMQDRIEGYEASQRAQHLHHSRHVRDLVEQFFLALECGADVTEELEAGLSDLRDEVARLEEHAPR